MELSQQLLFSRFPWAIPVYLKIKESEEGYFSDVTPWTFNAAQLILIHETLEEVEQWYQSKEKPIEIVIVEYKEVLGHVFIEAISGITEIEEIFVRIRTINLGFNER